MSVVTDEVTVRPTSHAPPTSQAAAADAPAWVAVCHLDQLERERGVAALVEGVQVALFRTYADEVYALDHRDPFSGAYVMARGIVGSRGDAPTVASPMFKQAFDLRTGRCLDDPDVGLGVHAVRVVDGVVEVALARAGAGTG